MRAAPTLIVLQLIASLLVVGSGPVAAQDPDALDAELLEDLGGDLLEDELLDPLAEQGEDLGESSPADDAGAPLAQIGLRMRAAHRLLAEKDASGRVSRLQEQVVQDLDELIRQAERRRKNSQQQGKPSPGSQRSSARPQGTQAAESGREGDQPAADSTDALREGAGGRAPSDPRSVREQVLKNLWGNLPERARQQMLQSQDDEFLPKYELEIEQYFRRLAEDPELDGR